MKHNLLKSVIISVILLMGVSHAWAGNNIAFQNGAHFYFDPYYSATQTIDKGYIQLAARKYQNSGDDDYGWYTAVTTLTKIANTRLYYTSTFVGPAWTDAGLAFHGWAMISNSTAKGNGDIEYWTGSNSTWYSEFKNYGLNKNSTYLFVATSASNGQSIEPNGTGYLNDGYSALNSQQTIKSAVNGADANSKATISITSYKMTGNGQVTQQTATLGTGSNVSYITAARTATTTLTVGSVATGYQFDGWYTEATGGSQLSSSTTYTYYPTAATTVYARFSEKKHNVTVQYKCGDMTLKNNTTLNNVGEITTSNASNAFITGFTFSGWTLGTGVTTSNSLTSESININTLSSGNYTLTANYTENSFAIRGGGQFGNTWDVSRPMTKQNASERIVYCTIPINGTNTGDAPTNQAFYFKVYDATKGQWYGLQAQDFTAYYYNRNAGELGLDGAYDAENIELRADVIGNYIFKIDYSDPERTPKITVTYPDGCFLSGDFNNWEDTHSLLEGPVTIPLTKGDHQFKVHRYDSDKANDYWCGNTGIMTRDGESVQSGGWDMTEGVDNCTLTADIPGDYTFTYDRSSGKMTVSYPEKRTVTLEGSSYGTFVVKCDNYQQTSSTSNRTLDVPAGATITITDIEPHNDGYDQTMVYSTGVYTEFDTYEVDNQGNRTYTYTVNNNVTIAEDFRTAEEHDIYLKIPNLPFKYWCNNEENAHPRILFMHGTNGQDASDEQKAREFELIYKNTSYRIYKITAPEGYHSFFIYSSHEFTASKVFDHEIIPADPTKNCYELTNEEVIKVDNVPSTKGQWIDPRFTVKIDYCPFGQFGITYNGETTMCHETEVKEVKVEPGDNIQIIDFTESSISNPEYIRNPRYEYSTVVQKVSDAKLINLDNNPNGLTYTVTEDIWVAPNIVTKNSHKVYLHIPDNLISQWNGNTETYKYNTMYLKDYLSSGQIIRDSDQKRVAHLLTAEKDEDLSNLGGGEYWRFDIPAEYHTFVIERKNNNNNDQSGEGNSLCSYTPTFYFGIPLDENIVYTLSSCEKNQYNQYSFKGTWDPLPTCTITLGYPHIGRFGIIVDGETIYASNQNKRDTYITVPYGTEVQLLKGEPGDAAYTNNLVKEINGQKEYIIFGDSEKQKTFTITSNVKFDDIFATKPNQTVFIAVPKNHAKLGKWYENTCSDTNHKYGHDVYAWQTKYPYDYQQDGQAKQTMQKKVAKIETDDYTYYQYTLDGHVYELDFQFKSAIDANGTWDSQAAHAGTKTSKCPPISTKNCFYLDGGIEGTNHVNGYTGYWDYGPPCKVEMGYTNIGRYGIKDYNNTIHYAIPGVTNTIFYVPYGSKVEVLEGEPGNNAYNGMVGLFNGNNVVKKFHDGQNQDNFVTITGYTMFDDLFISKAPHEVYLGVPNEGFDNWRLNDGERMTVRHLWPRDYIPSEYVNYEEMFVIDDITYYKFTLPQGLCSFQFSHRQQSNDSQISASRHFLYQIPVTEYNCFILENRQDGNGDYDGYWAKLPKPNVGDYRVLYAEKELIKTHEEGETEDWETAFHTVYEHPSDIIPKGEASKTISLHINTSQKRDGKTVHPMVILQQFQQIENNTYKWVNLQAHTVLPLKATGNMGMLPGRKKAFGDLPFYDDGIEAIKNDTTYSSRLDSLYKGSGVWNFTVTQGVSQSSTTVTLNVGNTTRYTGKYYIRTEALTNGWDDYTGNLMTYSDYADYNSGFSHYFCKWLLAGNNVKFTIANDYAQSISDPLFGDLTDLWGDPIKAQMVERDEALNEDANVRFAWYEMNNFVHRAYLGGSTHVHDRFLIVKGEDGKIFSHYVGEGLPTQGDSLPAGKNNGSDPRYGLYSDEEIFRDDANWIYHADIQILPGCTATVTARHYKQEQTFIKNRTLVYGEDLDDMKNQYPIRLLYDFKINRLITGYIPNGNDTTNIEAFTTNLMLIRREEPDDKDSKVTQLVFNTKAMDNSNTRAYGVLELSKERLVNDGNYNDLKRRLYWISFPFDVRIADVFGSGIYAQHWIIQSYNGQKRADNGYYYETTESNWEYHFDPNTINAGDPEYQGVLKKGVGYVVALNLYNIWKDRLLENTKDAICLYFPSKDLISANIVQNQDITIDVPEHECKKKGREIADSHWNVIGVPAYKNAGVNFDQPIDLSTKCAYYYRWDKAHNAYTPMASYTGEFSTLHAYMVQYHGGLNWTGVVREGTQSLAARSNTGDQIEHNLRLELQKDGKELDRTFVRLQENEDDVTSGFDFNYDLSKIINAGTNIYTIVKTNDLTTNVSGNVLPLAEDMVIPVGVVIDQAGEYTFSMPDGTAGITAELIDYQTNTRTNLLLDNYTVTLPAGTNNSRFALSLQPDKTVTSVDNIGNEATGDKVKKYLIDGKLYLQKDGVLYDAQGHAL